MRQSLLQDSSVISSSSTTDNLMYTMRDWRQSLRSPPTYRIGNRTIRFNYHFALFFLCILSLIFLFFYFNHGSTSSSDFALWSNRKAIQDTYNLTYPLTQPVIIHGIRKYRIGMVADLDTNSKIKKDHDVWSSFYKTGYLSYNPSKNTITIEWDQSEPIELQSSYSLKGRGMELSELLTFNGKLLTFDDRTGLIYEIQDKDKIIPWIILTDGDGNNMKGFKSEWATVKDHVLYVGSMGKEWTTSHGDYQNENPMWVKAISTTGEVKHLNWSLYYKLLREQMSITWPGYMIHESAMWSDIQQKWYFLPRRCSRDKYNETRDEKMGCNVLISVDDHFYNIEYRKIGRLKPTHGYSSFKFIPGTNDRIIVAIKTEELNGKTSTYISAFTIDGEILLDEEKIPTNYKYEGFEFI